MLVCCFFHFVELIYCFSSATRRADLFTTLIPSSCARSTISFLLRADTLWLITAAYFRLCMRRSSRSLTLATLKRNFPSAAWYLKRRSVPYPILGWGADPLNFLRMGLSIPWGFLHPVYIVIMKKKCRKKQKGCVCGNVMFECFFTLRRRILSEKKRWKRLVTFLVLIAIVVVCVFVVLKNNLCYFLYYTPFFPSPFFFPSFSRFSPYSVLFLFFLAVFFALSFSLYDIIHCVITFLIFFSF